jgi:hypothetical protein
VQEEMVEVEQEVQDNQDLHQQELMELLTLEEVVEDQVMIEVVGLADQESL